MNISDIAKMAGVSPAAVSRYLNQGYISEEAYGEQVKKALDFLNGNYQPVMKDLQAKMQEASMNLEFEEAVKYRDLLESVRKVSEKQKITDSDQEDKDVIALAKDDRDCVIQVFFVQGRRY